MWWAQELSGDYSGSLTHGAGAPPPSAAQTSAAPPSATPYGFEPSLDATEGVAEWESDWGAVLGNAGEGSGVGN